MLKAIIFDFDGVILNSVNLKTKAFYELYSRYGSNVAEEVKNYHIKNGGLSRVKKFEQFEKLIANKIIKVPFIKGANKFLKSNYKKYNFFISTGTPQKEIDEIIKAKRLEKYFINTYGSPSTKRSHIVKIIKKSNFKKKEVIFIGDSKNDFDAANKENIRFIGVGSNPFLKSKKIKMIRDLSELEKNLKSM